MREIKFRSYRKGVMHCGVYLEKLLSTAALTGFVEEAPSKVKWMQFTGLEDKSGVEVYAGDIIRWDGFGDYIVTWDGDSGCWNTELIGPCHEPHMSTNLFECSCDPKQEEAKVIGNIYENPELLEK
jgi:uncharacterized phage protein (TIGR01671 family)